MSGVWGNKIKYSIFGESHGKAIGITIDGLEAGIKLDLDFIKSEMKRRAPGGSSLTTSRKEGDEFNIISGFFNGYTTGTPLCAIIENKNAKSSNYEKSKNILRPSHADYTGYIKYKGFNDYRGGGHFSGRITAPLVFAGAVAKQILREKGIEVGSHIKKIGFIEDESFPAESINSEILKILKGERIPVINRDISSKMEEYILKVKNLGDSIGGIIEGAILHLPPGIGEPFFYSIESVLSQLFFSIPAVKAVEFGVGTEFASMLGSQANDGFCIKDGNPAMCSNNNGGILGGISNGMPIIFRVTVKPTPSIFKKQDTINIDSLEPCQIQIKGRHDPCIVIRAIPVVEAAAAIGILDFLA